MSLYRKRQSIEQRQNLSQNSRVVDMVDYMYRQFGVNYFEVIRYLSSTCYEELGCLPTQSKFTSYLARGRCMLFSQYQPKFIIDPMLSKFAWIHYVEVVDSWLPFHPLDEHFYTRKMKKIERHYLLSRNLYLELEISTFVTILNNRKSVIYVCVYVCTMCVRIHFFLFYWEWKTRYPSHYFREHNDTLPQLYEHIASKSTLVDDLITRYHMWLLEHSPELLTIKQVSPLMDKNNVCQISVWTKNFVKLFKAINERKNDTKTIYIYIYCRPTRRTTINTCWGKQKVVNKNACNFFSYATITYNIISKKKKKK
ncbi:hypothetical protein RFI_30757 [Reticulomyxa filosa]|uniref:Uncharacterized protein n=1 Tax=Reticulomyxa filosa TaxID=46433 RepID=X6LZ35_RETFI|nr:hypothetical protein RFI_30757 [Reticulomyxa filosa]|eukprot:ETO06636.1 hypothetical protein RFI_30757 [Reticulomyxa filosa]